MPGKTYTMATAALGVLAVLAASGCLQAGQQPGTYTIGEVALHDGAQDCWLAIDGRVYDVTPFINGHPGGEAILEGCGKDATGLYETRPMGSGTPHSEGARNMLQNYYIGDLAG